MNASGYKETVRRLLAEEIKRVAQSKDADLEVEAARLHAAYPDAGLSFSQISEEIADAARSAGGSGQQANGARGKRTRDEEVIN